MRDLARSVSERADYVAVIDDEGEHRAWELLDKARRLAKVTEGTVLVQADNSWRTVVAALAVGMSGGMLAVVSHHATRAEFAAAVEDIQPDVVIAAPSTMDSWVMAGEPVFDGWLAWRNEQPRDLSRWTGGSFVGLTSGSTGRAKGVVQTEEALRYACTRTIETNGLAPGDAVAAIVPLSSTAAFCFGVYLSLRLGGPLVLMDRWDPARAVARLAETDVRWTMCVPTMALQMGTAAAGSQALHGVRSITVGGGPMDRAALARAERSLGTRILRVFGMSECLGHTSPSPEDPEEIRLGRDGRPFAGTDLRAVSATGSVCAPGETGHAQVRGPSLFLGYARGGKVDPVALTEDGYFPTGDLLVTHDDGTVTIMGREKDVIIRGGRNIDITEIERAVAGHPGIEQACVVPVPDDLLGERIALLAVAVGDITLDEITAYLHERGLAKTKWPEYVFTVDSLPQTKVGKLDRRTARELARQRWSLRPAAIPPSTTNSAPVT